MSSRAARRRPRRVKAARRRRAGRDERKAAERAVGVAARRRAEAERQRQREAEQRHRARVRLELAPIPVMVAGTFLFPAAPTSNAAGAAATYVVRTIPSTHQRFALSRLYAPSWPRDSGGDRSDPHPADPEPTLYTPLWNGSGGTTSIDINILGDGD